MAEAPTFGKYYEFQKPLEGSATEILKAAIAASYPQSLICMTTDKRGTKLLIHGFLNVGSLREKFFLNDARQEALLPGCLIVASNAPGHLTIHHGDRGIIGFDRGVGFSATMDLLTSPALKEEFSEVLAEIRSSLPDRLQADISSQNHRESIVTFFLKIIDEIIFNIFQKRHGGIFLLVPERLYSLAKGDLKFRNTLKPATVWNAFLELPTLIPGIFMQGLPFKDRLKLFHSSLTSASGQVLDASKLLETVRRLREFTDFAASLSQVDGAVIMTTKLEIAGYGAEIRVNGRILPPTFLYTDGGPERIDPLIFGTRHRSTIRFCRKFPGAIGFVFSQDGGIKAIKGHKDHVMIFPEINRMRYDFFTG